MLISSTRTVKEVVELNVPAYFKSKFGSKHIHITQGEEVVIIQRGLLMIWRKEDGDHRDSAISDALSDRYESCSEKDFDTVYKEVLESIANAYQPVTIAR